ncbi:hypothetical protein [Sulfurimonas sp.]
MKKAAIVTSLICISISLYAFTDLGKWGQQYEITERIHWKDVNKSVITKAKVMKALDNAASTSETLPHCKKTQNRIWDPAVVLKKSIIMPKYHINIKKGTTFNPLKHIPQKRYYILIDGSDSNQTQLAEFYKNVSDIIIYNGSINAVSYTPTSQVYLANKVFTKTFKPRCLPSIYIEKDYKFLIKEINMKDLVEGKKDEKNH